MGHREDHLRGGDIRQLDGAVVAGHGDALLQAGEPPLDELLDLVVRDRHLLRGLQEAALIPGQARAQGHQAQRHGVEIGLRVQVLRRGAGEGRRGVVLGHGEEQAVPRIAHDPGRGQRDHPAQALLFDHDLRVQDQAVVLVAAQIDLEAPGRIQHDGPASARADQGDVQLLGALEQRPQHGRLVVLHPDPVPVMGDLARSHVREHAQLVEPVRLLGADDPRATGVHHALPVQPAADPGPARPASNRAHSQGVGSPGGGRRLTDPAQQRQLQVELQSDLGRWAVVEGGLERAVLLVVEHPLERALPSRGSGIG